MFQKYYKLKNVNGGLTILLVQELKKTFLFAARLGNISLFGRLEILRFIALVMVGMMVVASFFPSVSLACASCLLNPSWLHDYPDEEEMTEALLNFLLKYKPQLKERGPEGVVNDIWYLKIEYPPVDNFTPPLKEIILCIEELFNNESSAILRYSYTFLTHDPQKRYYFLSSPSAAFSSREKLEAYLDEFVISSVSGKKLVGDPVTVDLSRLKDLSEGKSQGGKQFSFSSLFIGIFAVGVFVLWWHKKSRL